jgi:GNAT superfamily N-acetyltransferase
MPVATSIVVRPATASRWHDVEALFGEKGACAGCWCMWFRKTRSEFARDRGARNKRSLAALVRSEAPPGLVAYAGREPVGWCAVAPRGDYSALERSRLFKPIDDLPVWSVTCFFVAREWRRRGVTVALLEGAAAWAKKKRAKALEGYPVVPQSGKAPDVYLYQGTLNTFLRAGFEVVKRPSPGRALVRRSLAT